MSDRSKTQPDQGSAADQRPVPSQAEGDLKTVEEDLKAKEKEKEAAATKR